MEKITTREREVLQEIVDRNGDCLEAARCDDCPFRKKCLPRFLKFRFSKAHRVEMAITHLARQDLMEEEIEGAT